MNGRLILFSFVVAASLGLAAQDRPKLPPVTPATPTHPAISAVPKMNCPPGSHPSASPQFSVCFPDCPKGWHAKTAKTPDACIKGNNACVVLSTYISHDHSPYITHDRLPAPPWEVFLCDAKPVVRSKIDAIYPPDSVRAHQEGTAEFVVNGKPDGTVQVVTAPRLAPLRLQRAGKTALDQWRWRPYRFEGQAIPFRTSVYFKFEIVAGDPRVQTLLTQETDKPK